MKSHHPLTAVSVDLKYSYWTKYSILLFYWPNTVYFEFPLVSCTVYFFIWLNAFTPSLTISLFVFQTGRSDWKAVWDAALVYGCVNVKNDFPNLKWLCKWCWLCLLICDWEFNYIINYYRKQNEAWHIWMWMFWEMKEESRTVIPFY